VLATEPFCLGTATNNSKTGLIIMLFRRLDQSNINALVFTTHIQKETLDNANIFRKLELSNVSLNKNWELQFNDFFYAVFFYVRYGVSYRDLEEIMEERGFCRKHRLIVPTAIADYQPSHSLSMAGSVGCRI
jgi:hypothetical protein